MKPFRPVAKISICVMLLCTLSSCIHLKEHLILHSDGSGTLLLEVQAETSFQQIFSRMESFFESSQASFPQYPPVTEESLRSLFPGDAFRIEVRELQEKIFAYGIAAEIAFDDINDLLASPYGDARSLEFVREGERLNMRSRTGLESVVFALTHDTSAAIRRLGVVIPKDTKKSEALIEFQVTLPNPPVDGNGRLVDNRSVWSIAAANVDDAQLQTEAASVMTVSCEATGLTFTPQTPVRLALDSFDRLQSQPVSTGRQESGSIVTGPVTFVPHSLRVTRTFDMSGEGYSFSENYSVLTGLVVVPKPFAPSTWGAAQLLEVTDDLGEDLTLNMDDDESSQESSPRSPLPTPAENQEYAAHPVEFLFHVPAKGARELARVSGEIEALYFSDMEILKVEQALTRDDIYDMDRARDQWGDVDEKTLDDPALQKAGIAITLEQNIITGGILVIIPDIEEHAAVISAIQLFDVHGAPWPTWFLRNPDRSQIIVLGTPEPPLSLAFLVRSGQSVTIPFAVSNIALTPSH